MCKRVSLHATIHQFTESVECIRFLVKQNTELSIATNIVHYVIQETKELFLSQLAL